MPSAVSTSVNVLPAARATVCAPLEYEPFAMAIRATPLPKETSRKSGFALGKLVPTRTTWARPLTTILAAPVTASTRDACFGGVVAPLPAEAGAWLTAAVWLGRPCALSLTCWTNGSLPRKRVNEWSCDFPTRGATSEVGSLVLAAGVTAAAAVPGGVVAGAAVPATGAEAFV